jgi:RNA polymerase sigma factor (sigma-70 family)
VPKRRKRGVYLRARLEARGQLRLRLEFPAPKAPNALAMKQNPQVLVVEFESVYLTTERLIGATQRRFTSTDPAEIESMARRGLAMALKDFKPGKRATFRTYALKLVRGWMSKAARAQDHVPRSVREALNKGAIEETRRDLPPVSIQEESSTELPGIVLESELAEARPREVLEARELVRTLLELLPAETAALLHAHFILGEDKRELAARFNVTTEVISYRLTAALAAARWKAESEGLVDG